MSFATPQIVDNGMARASTPGDILNTNERIESDATAAGITWNARQVLASIFSRSGPGAGYADATPDSNTWINALLQGGYLGSGAITPLGVQVGSTYRFRVLSTVAFANTITAGTGVTLAGVTAVAASSYRDYLITILNGTPQQLFAVSTTNASAVITGMSAAQTALVSPGMLVSGTGIQAGSTVLSVQPGVGVTLSLAATATGALVAATFNPRIEVRGIGGGLI